MNYFTVSGTKSTYPSGISSYNVSFMGKFTPTKKYIYNFVNKDNTTEKDWQKFFYTLSEPIKKCITATVEKYKRYGLTIKDYLPLAAKGDLLYLTADVIENKVSYIVKAFEKEGLNKDDFMKAWKKVPKLLTNSPETLEKNVRSVVDAFKEQGLETSVYLKACLEQPTLFYQSPETIQQNVKVVVDIFKDRGLTLENYLNSCISTPSLFCRDPKSIEKNITKITDLYKKDGLTPENYISCCVKQPHLFYTKPETIQEKLSKVIRTFEKDDLSAENYLKACCRMPSLFYRDSEATIRNIKALILAKKTAHPEISDAKALQEVLDRPILITYSPLLIYLDKIVVPQMKAQDKNMACVWGNGIKLKLIKYLEQNKDKNYIIKLKHDEMNDDLVASVNKFFLDNLGSDFKVNYRIFQ